MLVKIERKIFFSLDDSELGWACIEPTLLKIRGKDSILKTRVYSELTKGQQALLMFRVLYDHAKDSKTEFNAWMNVLFNQQHTWLEIKAGLKYFEDATMLQFFDEVESSLKKSIDIQENLNNKGCQHLGTDFLDEQFYLDFCRITQETVHLISTYIRDNPEEFVRITD